MKKILKYMCAFIFVFSLISVAVYASDFQIVSQPSSLTVREGYAATFSVETVGGRNVVYQWQFAFPSAPNVWNMFINSNQPSYSFIASSEYNGARFRCYITYDTDSGVHSYKYSNTVLLAVLSEEQEVVEPVYSTLFYSILGVQNFSYMQTLTARDYVYTSYSDYLGYNEITENGFTIYNNICPSPTWLKTNTATYSSMIITIPFNMGVLSADQTIHLQFAFCSAGLSDTYQRNVSVSAGTAFNTSTAVTINPCNVQFTANDGYIECGTYASDGSPMRWYLIDIDVSRNVSSGANNNYGDFKYLFIRINFRYDRSSGKYFRFGFTNNNSFGDPSMESIYNGIVNIDSDLQSVIDELSELRFSVDNIDNTVLLIYDLLRNSSTQSIVQNITNQLSEMITPSQEWVEIIEELNEKFEDQESTLSDLGEILESLDKPNIVTVVPSSDAVLDTDYVDMSLVSDVFSPVFEDQTIIWLLLAAIGLVTISFVLFGKKS